MFTSSQGGFVCGRFFARMIHIWTSLHKDISFVEHFSQGRFGGLVLCGPATSPLVTGKFFFEFLMKVLTEVHCGILLGNPKFQVNSLYLIQYTSPRNKILKCSVFSTVILYFPMNYFWNISTHSRVISERRIFIFNSVFKQCTAFFRLFCTKKYAKIA